RVVANGDRAMAAAHLDIDRLERASVERVDAAPRFDRPLDLDLAELRLRAIAQPERISREGVDPGLRNLEPCARRLDGRLAGADLATFDRRRSRPCADADLTTAEPTVVDRHGGLVRDVDPEADAGELALLDRCRGAVGDRHRRAAAHRCGQQQARAYGE